MSRGQPSASQQTKSRSKGGSGGRPSGRVVNVYLHAVTDGQATLLADTATTRPLWEVEKSSGARVMLDSKASPVPGMKVVVITGHPSQIHTAVRLISHKTGAQGTLPDQAQTFWLQWVEASFPDLVSRAYFLPPVYFNRVPMTRQSIAAQDVLVLQSASGQASQSSQSASGQAGQSSQSASGRAGQSSQSASGRAGQSSQSASGRAGLSSQSASGRAGQSSQSASGQAGQSSRSVKTPSAAQTCLPQPPRVQDSDVRDDAAMQRVLFCLKEMAEQKGEVLFAMSNLQFGEYLGEPCYAAAAAQLALPATLPSTRPPNWKQGDFDVLLIHRHYGFVVCEVKAFGDNVHALKMSPQVIQDKIRDKLKEAATQLDKAAAMLSHLVSDITPGLHITKVIAVPNLKADQVKQALSCHKQLTQDLCLCLGTTDPADIPGLCLCCDQLSDPKTPCDVSSHVLGELGHWWQRRVAGAGPDSHMTDAVYKTLVARFCGPATTVTVPCTCPPRVSVKTLGQAVWWTGEVYTAVITLFPEQVHLLHTAPPRLFVTGPPGTGKTVVLLMMGIKWLRCGHHVYVVSTWVGSLAACTMLYHLLLQAVKTLQSAGVSPGQPHLLLYHLYNGKDVEKVVNYLSQAAIGGSLYVIADEAEGFSGMTTFPLFCNKLLTQVPRLHLWAASCLHQRAPSGWQVESLTRPLRSPPAVVREVEQDEWIARNNLIHPYSERGVPDHTDGPPVTRLYHRGQGHAGRWPDDCVTCAREVASFLHSLGVGVTGSGTTTLTTVTSKSCGTTPPSLQWRDVLVLNWNSESDNSGMVKALQEAGIPVRVMTDDDIEDVATARSDVVWVACGDRVRGLERKVVVCMKDIDSQTRMTVVIKRGEGNPAMKITTFPRRDLMSRCTSQLMIIFPDPQAPDDD